MQSRNIEKAAHQKKLGFRHGAFGLGSFALGTLANLVPHSPWINAAGAVLTGLGLAGIRASGVAERKEEVYSHRVSTVTFYAPRRDRSQQQQRQQPPKKRLWRRDRSSAARSAESRAR